MPEISEALEAFLRISGENSGTIHEGIRTLDKQLASDWWEALQEAAGEFRALLREEGA